MGTRPTGTVTFLFTEIEGSTRLWEDHPAEMQVVLERHDEILRQGALPLPILDDHMGRWSERQVERP